MEKQSKGTRRFVAIVKERSAMNVAIALGCTPATVHNIRNGANPSLHLAIRAAEVYKIDPKLWEEF